MPILMPPDCLMSSRKVEKKRTSTFSPLIGSYNRFDIFKLTVDRSENRPVTFVAEDISREAGASRESDPNDPQSSNILEIAG